MTEKINGNKKFIIISFGAILWLVLMFAMSATVHAAPQHSFGTGQGRNGRANENDFHTASWERFSFNYQFTSGPDHRFELGRPTTFNGFVPADVFTVNIRRDANVSLRPPSYGIFSGHIPTTPSNHLFPQPVNPHFHQPFQLQDPGLNPRFDTLQQGVNAQPIGNPVNVQQGANTGGFLPPTSVN